MRPYISLYQDGKEIEKIDFGLVEVGTSKKIDIEIKNTGNAQLFNIVYVIDNPEVKILSKVTKLDPKLSGFLTLQYTPSQESKKGLKVKLYIKGVYVV